MPRLLGLQHVRTDSRFICAAGPGSTSDSNQLASHPAMVLQQQGDEEEAPDPFAPRAEATAQGGAPAAARPRRRMGVLQSVPTISPAHEHLASALKRASKVRLCMA